MTKGLSKAQVEHYRRDGYLCPITVLAAGQAAHYRAALEAAEAAAGGSLPGPLPAQAAPGLRLGAGADPPAGDPRCGRGA